MEFAVRKARRNSEGQTANYIPELASVPLERTSAALKLVDGDTLLAGDAAEHDFTFQSSAKGT